MHLLDVHVDLKKKNFFLVEIEKNQKNYLTSLITNFIELFEVIYIFILYRDINVFIIICIVQRQVVKKFQYIIIGNETTF